MVQTEYGAPEDVLRLQDVPKPTITDQQVLVRVRASSANPWDWHFVRGEPVLLRPTGIGGIRKPKFPIPGGDVAGTVAEVGAAVSEVAPGDQVYGFGHGAFADYLAINQRSITRKPSNLTFEQAAAVPLAAVTALQGLRLGRFHAGQHVLVVGASGGVGTFAVQLAKHMGGEVTGVCSTPHVDLVRHLGADHVIDYTSADVTAARERYDVVFTLGGTYSPSALRRTLTRTGALVMSSGDGGRWLGPVGTMVRALALNVVVPQTLKPLNATMRRDDLDEIRTLVENGTVTPVIGSTFSLAEGAAAIRHVEEGSPAGKVIVTID
jgi:NADPH:quinone reductase-like Zn-dependent oxidoreductase